MVIRGVGSRSMDVTFNNVLEGTRQYFMGLPKQAQAEGSGQSMWPAGAPPPEEGAPAQSGAPAPTSRPPSAAAAPPSAPAATPSAAPPRPPSEPLEPEPHIIHKATVMREAAEKRRELPEPEDEEEPMNAISPPTHIIRKPPPRALQSPAPGPAAPSPTPVRPPSATSLQPQPTPEPHPEASTQYRPPMHRVQTPTARPAEHFAPGRPPDQYTTSRPPESYPRYHYDPNLSDGSRSSHGSVVASPQPPAPPRHNSPQQTYARLSSSVPQHAATRLREATAHSPPASRFSLPPTQPTAPHPHNDRVPPIHHPQALVSSERRSPQVYATLPQRHEPSHFSRTSSHYERQTIPPRKYDHQQSYPGYRQTQTVAQTVQSQRAEIHHQVQYKHPTMDVLSAAYAARPPDRTAAPHPHDSNRLLPQRPADYPHVSRNIDARGSYHYQSPSTSSACYPPAAPGPVNQTQQQTRTTYRPLTVPKSSTDYVAANHIPPTRPAVKPGYPTQQARMTVSVTSLVNEMNQTKHKKESPLDLSVKTVKNSADSSTTVDDALDPVSLGSKNLPLQSRPLPSSRHIPQNIPVFAASHKVDFAPDFTQYRETNNNHSPAMPSGHPQARYNGVYEAPRATTEAYPAESRQHRYHDRSKYNVPIGTRPNYVPRIDLTTSIPEVRHPESRIRDDRNFKIGERKRPTGPIVNNIPEKIVRYETWTADSRIADRSNRPSRDQHDILSQPVYSYSNQKRYETYHGDHKRPVSSSIYHEHHPHINHGYPYPPEVLSRETRDYHAQYASERNPSSNSRQVIQKIPSHRDMHTHSLEPHSGVPADKRVLSILRNSLETKQTGLSDIARPRQIPELIVIDDVDDSVIEITDLTKENDVDFNDKNVGKIIQNKSNASLSHHIQMPKAVDSILKDSDYQKVENVDPISKSPENDVASRIRTKAELKVMPPSQDPHFKPEIRQSAGLGNHENIKLTPKSQKQHLFNQIREDLRLESVIKNEKPSETFKTDIKSEPINIEEIEKDAVISIKTENLDSECTAPEDNIANDLDWASACDNFMEQLKSGCHKKKPRKRRIETLDQDNTVHVENSLTHKAETKEEATLNEAVPAIIIKQEPVDPDENSQSLETEMSEETQETVLKSSESELTPSKEPEQKISLPKDPVLKNPEIDENSEKESVQKPQVSKEHAKKEYLSKQNATKDTDKRERTRNTKKLKESTKSPKSLSQRKSLCDKSEPSSLTSSVKPIKCSAKDKESLKAVIKHENESTDDDEPLIKSKIIKEKERNEKLKYAMLNDMSVYVKLECCDVDVSKFTKKSNDTNLKDKDDKQTKTKLVRKALRSKGKSLSIDNNKRDTRKDDSSSESEDEDLTVASRLRVRKSIKTEDSKIPTTIKNSVKASPMKKTQNNINSNASATVPMKTGFGDGSDFHPGWEEELYRYKRSLRMPSRLIAIPRGRSGGPFVKGSSTLFTRGSTSLPDLDPAPLSPAPSSAPSAATDDLYARRPDKLTLDSDLDSNSSYSALNNRLHSDSEASTSTVFSTKLKKKASSIVDVLIQKCGKKEDKKKSKEKDDKMNTPKLIPKSSNTTELLATPSLGLMKSGTRGILSAKKEKLMEDIYYLGAFRKETVTAFRNAFINNTDGLMGATEEFAPVVLKSRTRTESRVIKQRATIKEVFGDERPASAPPSACRNHEEDEDKPDKELEVKKEPEIKSKIKPKKIMKDKLLRRSSSIRDGLRSTKSLKRNDAKGRLMRLKKRNNLIKSLANKRLKDISVPKIKKDKSPSPDDKVTSKDEDSTPGTTEGNSKRRLKRLFGRRKFSSGFDYIRKKKKIIRRDEPSKQLRRPAAKPSPESVHDIQKEIKGWFINKSIGESHLHRAARLGYTVSNFIK